MRVIGLIISVEFVVNISLTRPTMFKQFIGGEQKT